MELIDNFKKKGNDKKELHLIKNRVIEPRTNRAQRSETDTITFPVHYFEELKDFRKILTGAETDIQTLIGDASIIMAIKKNPSIGSKIVKNKQLCSLQIELENQKCNEPNCQQ